MVGGGLSCILVDALFSIQDYASFLTNWKQDQEPEGHHRASRGTRQHIDTNAIR